MRFIVLIAAKTEKVIKELKWRKSSCVMGSGERCDVRIRREGVCDVHAIFTRRSEGDIQVEESESAWIRRCGSEGEPLLVNGETVEEKDGERRLLTGDIISIAGRVFKYEERPSETTPPPPTTSSSTATTTTTTSATTTTTAEKQQQPPPTQTVATDALLCAILRSQPSPPSDASGVRDEKEKAEQHGQGDTGEDTILTPQVSKAPAMTPAETTRDQLGERSTSEEEEREEEEEEVQPQNASPKKKKKAQDQGTQTEVEERKEKTSETKAAQAPSEKKKKKKKKKERRTMARRSSETEDVSSSSGETKKRRAKGRHKAEAKMKRKSKEKKESSSESESESESKSEPGSKGEEEQKPGKERRLHSLFVGITFIISGIAGADRVDLKATLRGFGGKVVGAFESKPMPVPWESPCTVVITRRDEDGKGIERSGNVLLAAACHMPCVCEDWVEKSIEKGHLMPIEDFAPPIVGRHGELYKQPLAFDAPLLTKSGEDGPEPMCLMLSATDSRGNRRLSRTRRGRDKEYWTWLLQLLGARIVEPPKRHFDMHLCIVFKPRDGETDGSERSESSPCRRLVGGGAEEVQLVRVDWAADCLLENRKLRISDEYKIS